MRLLLVKILLIASITAFLPGCETVKNLFSKDADSGKDDYVGWNEAEFHRQAKEAMQSGNYDKAIKLYEALESRFPFGEYAIQTQLDIAYAYHKNADAEAAIAAADRFIKINPRNPNVDYAYYLKGLVNYNRGFGFIDRYLPTDSSQRDTNNAKESLNIFQELIRRFPNSKYVPDAKQRMVSLRNNLAMHEVHIARYYLKRKAYVAAISRCNYVMQEYQKTPAVPQALQIMQEAYTAMGLTSLASDAKRVYDTNYAKGVAGSGQPSSFVYDTWDFIGLDK